MSTDSGNITSNSNRESSLLPASQCIPWILLLITESLAIVILNIITIIVFATLRQPQRRGTYLLIRNLAIVDLLVGLISGPLEIEGNVGRFCNLWNFNTNRTWAYYLKFALLHLFPMASLGNLVAISLERMHATFWPSKHLFTKKRIYKVIIVAIWVTAVIREIAQIALLETPSFDPGLLNSTLYLPYYVVSLLVICVSYISIFIKIRCSPRPRPQNLHNGVTARERKLTFILFVVSVASLLAWLPVMVFISVESFQVEALLDRSSSSYFHIRMTALTFFLANSLANSVIYSMQMKGYQAGLAVIFRKNLNHVNAADLPLRQFSS